MADSAAGGKAVNAGFAAFALMLGNFVYGLAVLLPAGMAEELASGLAVSIRDVGLLIAFGAAVVCFASPLMAWATSTWDRRTLLSVMVAIIAAGHVVSALAPNYITLLIARLVILGTGAAYTPLAATTIALIVTERELPSRITFVFLGWSFALAAGLPMVAFVAGQLGWRMTYNALAGVAAINVILLALSLPGGLRGASLSLGSWGQIARNRQIILLLLISMLWTAGLYVLFPYLGPLVARLAGGGPEATAVLFAIIGVVGLVSNVIATRAVNFLGTYRTAFIAAVLLVLGTFIWAVGAGSLLVMGAGMLLLGFGFALNSMQQARLIAAAPALGSASVALNTSLVYVGQAAGSVIGGFMFSHNLLVAMGYASTALMFAALVGLVLTRSGSGRTPA